MEYRLTHFEHLEIKMENVNRISSKMSDAKIIEQLKREARSFT